MLTELCSIDACTKPARCRTWCEPHYRRFLRSGDPLKPGTRRYHEGLCSFEGCGRPVRTGGFCKQHYDQHRAGVELYPLRDTPQNLYVNADKQERECGICHDIKPFSDFYSSVRGAAGRVPTCVPCNRSYQANHRKSHPRPAYLRHGLTKDEFDRMWQAQEGRCALCPRSLKLGCCIDHDHAHCPGRCGCELCVRGLLCPMCNTRLGTLENMEWTTAARAYLASNNYVAGE